MISNEPVIKMTAIVKRVLSAIITEKSSTLALAKLRR